MASSMRPMRVNAMARFDRTSYRGGPAARHAAYWLVAGSRCRRAIPWSASAQALVAGDNGESSPHAKPPTAQATNNQPSLRRQGHAFDLRPPAGARQFDIDLTAPAPENVEI